MTLSREVLPGRCYMVTRRCIQRHFLLRPDKETNHAFIYCLAEAAQSESLSLLPGIPGLVLLMFFHLHDPERARACSRAACRSWRPHLLLG